MRWVNTHLLLARCSLFVSFVLMCVSTRSRQLSLALLSPVATHANEKFAKTSISCIFLVPISLLLTCTCVRVSTGYTIESYSSSSIADRENKPGSSCSLGWYIRDIRILYANTHLALTYIKRTVREQRGDPGAVRARFPLSCRLSSGSVHIALGRLHSHTQHTHIFTPSISPSIAHTHSHTDLC